MSEQTAKSGAFRHWAKANGRLSERLNGTTVTRSPFWPGGGLRWAILSLAASVRDSRVDAFQSRPLNSTHVLTSLA